MRGRPEEILARNAIAAITAPDVSAYRNEVGTGYHRVVAPLIRKALAGSDRLAAVEKILASHVVNYGLGAFGRITAEGSPDWFLTVRGRSLALELKATHTDSCSCKSCSEQRIWLDAFARRGGLVAKARTVEDVVAAVERARRGG